MKHCKKECSAVGSSAGHHSAGVPPRYIPLEVRIVWLETKDPRMEYRIFERQDSDV
jgi:hypothetical protein